MKKRFLAFLLILCMSLTMLPAVTAAAAYPDMPDDYSTVPLDWAVTNELMQGHTDGRLDPIGQMTRAQMAALLVRAFQASKAASLKGYSDVVESAWYYPEMEAAVRMSIFRGDAEGTLRPNAPITRQEAFLVLNRAFFLGSGDTAVLSVFNDVSSIASWAAPEIASMVENGFIQGDENGNIRPLDNISRKDFAVVMWRMMRTFIDQPGEVTEIGRGTVVIRCGGVTLKNVTINGDLIIADGVDIGSIILDNVTVTGRVIVMSGNVTVKNASKLDEVILSGRAEPGTFTVEGDQASVGSAEVVGNDMSVESQKVKFDVTAAEGVTGTKVNGKDLAGGDTVSTVEKTETSTPSAPYVPYVPAPVDVDRLLNDAIDEINLCINSYACVNYLFDNVITVMIADDSVNTVPMSQVRTDISAKLVELLNTTTDVRSITSNGNTIQLNGAVTEAQVVAFVKNLALTDVTSGNPIGGLIGQSFDVTVIDVNGYSNSYSVMFVDLNGLLDFAAEKIDAVIADYAGITYDPALSTGTFEITFDDAAVLVGQVKEDIADILIGMLNASNSIKRLGYEAGSVVLDLDYDVTEATLLTFVLDFDLGVSASSPVSALVGMLRKLTVCNFKGAHVYKFMNFPAVIIPA